MPADATAIDRARPSAGYKFRYVSSKFVISLDQITSIKMATKMLRNWSVLWVLTYYCYHHGHYMFFLRRHECNKNTIEDWNNATSNYSIPTWWLCRGQSPRYSADFFLLVISMLFILAACWSSWHSPHPEWRLPCNVPAPARHHSVHIKQYTIIFLAFNSALYFNQYLIAYTGFPMVVCAVSVNITKLKIKDHNVKMVLMDLMANH